MTLDERPVTPERPESPRPESPRPLSHQVAFHQPTPHRLAPGNQRVTTRQVIGGVTLMLLGGAFAGVVIALVAR